MQKAELLKLNGRTKGCTKNLFFTKKIRIWPFFNLIFFPGAIYALLAGAVTGGAHLKGLAHNLS